MWFHLFDLFSNKCMRVSVELLSSRFQTETRAGSSSGFSSELPLNACQFSFAASHGRKSLPTIKSRFGNGLDFCLECSPNKSFSLKASSAQKADLKSRTRTYNYNKRAKEHNVHKVVITTRVCLPTGLPAPKGNMYGVKTISTIVH